MNKQELDLMQQYYDIAKQELEFLSVKAKLFADSMNRENKVPANWPYNSVSDLKAALEKADRFLARFDTICYLTYKEVKNEKNL